MLRRSAFKLWLAAGIVMISFACVLYRCSSSEKRMHTVLWEVDRGSLDSAAYSPDGQTIIAECLLHLCFFDSATGKLVNSISLPAYPRSSSIAYLGPVYSLDGKWIAVPGFGGAVVINSQTTETERSFKTPEAEVYSVHFNQDDTQLLTSDSKRHIIIWDVETGEEVISWETGECSNYGGCWLSATFSPDGEQVVTTDAAGNVTLWDASNGEKVRVFVGHTGIVLQAHFDAEGKKLVTTGYVDPVRVWDVDSGEQLFALDTPGWVSDAEFSPDGRYIAVVIWMAPSDVRLYDAETGELVYDYPELSKYQYDVAFHPSEPWFVVAGDPYIVNYLIPDTFPDS